MARLTVADVGFMLEELPIGPELRARLLKLPVRSNALTDAELDALRDLAGERLQVAGFDSEYAPNAIGRALESLIDRLFIG